MAASGFAMPYEEPGLLGSGAGSAGGLGGSAMKNFAGGGGFGAIGSILGSLFGMGDQKDPYKDAMGTIQNGYNPYIQQGMQINPLYMQQIMSLMQNPGDVMNKIGASFQKSPGYDFQLNQGLNAANNAAAAGGFAGNAANQQNASQVASGLANQDYYNYLNHAMQMYNQGLNGANNISQRGYNASDSLAKILSSMQIAQTQSQNQANSDFWGNLIGGGAQIAALAMM